MRKGFTLSEVLITLGIIGVAAALTMPSLIANYKKKAWVTQLQKSVSVWDNGFRLMLAREEVGSMYETEFAQTIVNSGRTIYGGSAASDFTEATDILKKYFKIIKIEDGVFSFNQLSGVGKYNESYRFIVLYMADGAKYYVYMKDLDKDWVAPFPYGGYGVIYIDVNGDKKPNVLGRDIFLFHPTKTGILLSAYSREGADLWGGMYWKNYSTACGVPGSIKMAGVHGGGCAVRIIENGWVMDY